MRVGGDVAPPIAVTRVEPVYTDVARKARISGVVIIETIIDRNGNVTDAGAGQINGMPINAQMRRLQFAARLDF